jgi:hypothetical protein
MVKIVCSVCNSEGLLQVIGKHYFRVRHYDGTDSETHKPKFYYHPVLEDYANQQLALTNQSLPCKVSSMALKNNSLTKVNLDQPKLSLECDSKSWGWELNPYITALQAVA